MLNKKNEIIQNASFNLTKTQLRLINKIFERINSFDNEFKQVYRFDVRDFINDLNLNANNITYFKQELIKLSDKGFTVYNNNNEIYSRWISSIKHIDNTNIFEVEIPLFLKEFYLNLNEQFTQLKTDIFLQFKSKYSIRLYEILTSIQNKRTKEFFISYRDLKQLLGISEDKYKRFSNFKNKVIVTAQKELSDKGVKFSFKVSGRGQNSYIRFFL